MNAIQSLKVQVIEESYAIFYSPQFQNNFLPGKISNGATVWKNPDNIGYNSLGQCFFALELFRHTQDEKIMEALTGYLELLENYRDTVKTNNYSLFHGRLGLAYCCLLLYKETQLEKYLHRSVAITKEYLNEESRQFKIFDHKGIVSGMAGMLLHYLALYNEIGEEWLYTSIEQHILALTGKINLAETGYYWNTTGPFDNRHTGWAYGNAGIAFSFLEAGKYFNNKALFAIADNALRYEDELLARQELDSNITGKFNGQFFPYKDVEPAEYDDSFAQGIVGQQLVRLYASVQNGNNKYKEGWNALAVTLNQVLSSLSPNNIEPGIFKGLAGWGLAFREASSITMNDQYMDTVHAIAALLTEKLAAGKTSLEKDLSFFNGITGVGYFLLKAVEPGYSPSLILPRITGNANRTGKDIPVIKPEMSISRNIINTMVVKNNFGKTYSFLENHFPLELKSLVTEQSFISPVIFNRWINELAKEKIPADETGLFELEINKEMAINRLRNGGPQPSDDIEFAKKTDVLLNLPINDFLQMRLVISDEIYMVRTEDEVNFSLPLTPESLMYLLFTYGKKTVYLKINSYYDVEEEALGALRLYADLFREPALVNTVVNKIVDYIAGQQESIVAMVSERLQAASEEELRNKLTQTALEDIQTLIIMSVLVSSDELS